MDSLLQFTDLVDTEMSISPLLTEMAYTTDPNNNDDFETTTAPGKGDKYSLRPRSVRRVTETLTKTAPKATTTAAASHNSSTKNTTAATGGGGGGTKPPKTHKPKQKPAPLSKYRRKTANARERNRMREINQAFETLRRVIPQMAAAPPAAAPNSAAANANEKLTKITTLRLAMKYISSLSAALDEPSSGSACGGGTTASGMPSALETFFLEPSLSDCSDLDCLLLESDGESLPLSDHSSLLASPDFPDTSLSPVDFGDPNSLSPFLQTDYDHTDFSDFLLT